MELMSLIRLRVFGGFCFLFVILFVFVVLWILIFIG